MKQNGFFAEVVKTDKIKVDESSHRLPPHNGAYPEHKVADYFCPEEWSNDGIFIPVNEGDPLWFDFRGNSDECAILCAVQRINPVTGEPADLDSGLAKDPAQNYLRMPEQQWLDGYAKDGKVYQFVVTKAGIGLAVNEFVLPVHMQDSHAIGFAFFGPKNPKPKPVYRDVHHHHYDDVYWTFGGSSGLRGLIGSNSYAPESGSILQELGSSHTALDCGTTSKPTIMMNCSSPIVDRAQISKTSDIVEAGGEVWVESVDTVDILAEQAANLKELDKASMGAGGRIVQSITTDDNTVDYYHEKRSALLTIYFALPEMFKVIMKKGKRQDASRKDKYKVSGQIGGIPVPLVE